MSIDMGDFRGSYLRKAGINGGELELVDTKGKGQKLHSKSLKLPDLKNAGENEHIIILGAGIAGLTLAYELLKETSYRVTILEAKDRVGGRSLTLRKGDSFTEHGNGVKQTCTFDKSGTTGEPYLNAGPGRIPSSHRNVLNYCKALNVELEVYVMESRSNLMRTLQGFGCKPVVDRQLANDPRGYFAEYLYENVEALIKYLLQKDGICKPTKRDKKNLKKWLKRFGALDKNGKYEGTNRSGYTELPGTTYGTVEPPLPFKDILKSCFWELGFYQPEDFLWQQTSFQPVGGMDKIVKALLREVKAMGGRVVLNAPVSKIKRKDEQWVVSYRGNSLQVSGEKCVSNIPIPLLNGMVDKADFDLDYWKALEKVMESEGFLEPTCKVGWQSSRKYWQDPVDKNTVPIFGGISRIAPNRMDQMWYPSNDYQDENGILTGAYNFRANAKDWGEKLPEQRIEEARNGAAELHGQEFACQLKHGISIAWQNMEYQKGGWANWSNVTKVQTEKESLSGFMIDGIREQADFSGRKADPDAWYYNQLQRESDGFFITGDQVSRLPGWQEGAMASALQVFGMLNLGDHIQPVVVSQVPNTRALVEGK